MKFITSLIIILFLNSCEKSDRNDASGVSIQDKFSCTIANEYFSPKTALTLNVIYEIEENNHVLFFIARNNTKRYTEIKFQIVRESAPPKEGTYNLTSFSPGSAMDSMGSCYFEISGKKQITLVDESSFYTTEKHNGAVIIDKFDIETRTIKGSFSFDASNNFGDVINIRNGQFNTEF